MTSKAREELADIDRRLRLALMAFFMRRTGNRVEAEDLTQDVFIRLARHHGDSGDFPDAYVFRVAANLLRDKARRDRVRTDYRATKTLEDYLGIDLLDPFRIASGRQDLIHLADRLARLPEKTRRIFTLYRLESVDKRTIADSLGLSVRMIEIHIQRALVMLAEAPGDAR